MIGVENKTVNRPNDNDDSVVVVEKGRETDQFNKKKDDQVVDNKVKNDDMSESDKMYVINMLKMMFDEQNAILNKRFDELSIVRRHCSSTNLSLIHIF